MSGLKLKYNTSCKYEICLDEVGRGPLFGRVYIGAVILPSISNNNTVDSNINDTEIIPIIDNPKNSKKEVSYKDIKDSKKFSSKKKIKDVSDFIRKKCPLYAIHYADAEIIDDINILQSVYKCMHSCIRELIEKIKELDPTFDIRKDIQILVDGDRFKPYCMFDENTESIIQIPHETIEKGDAIYMGIAAASIIAKVEHDEYISNLCIQYPELNIRYGLEKNVGYGTKQHMNGIKQYGITQWHRKSYGPCKECEYSPL
jgi:ribonuclease HII